MSITIITLVISIISLVLNIINTSLFISLVKGLKGPDEKSKSTKSVTYTYDILSIKEREAANMLKKVDHESIWGIAIRNVFSNWDVVRFRRLICDLKSQANDNMESMRNILGNETLNAVMNV